MSSARSPRPRRAAPSRSVSFKIQPAAVLLIVVVLALFIGGAVIGGLVGGLMIGALGVAAGALLVLRWRAIDPQIRLFRLVVVLATLAVAVTVIVKG